MLKILHRNKIYPEINASNEIGDMPMFLLGSDTWAKHRCQLFLSSEPHNAIWAASKTWLPFLLWIFHIYCRNLSLLFGSITRTLEELSCSWTKSTNWISDIPSHLIYSLHCRYLCISKTEMSLSSETREQWWFKQWWIKNMGFGATWNFAYHWL